MRVAQSYYTEAVMLLTGHAGRAVVLYRDGSAVRLFLLEKRVQKSYSKQAYPYSSLSAAMDPADIKAAAAEKARNKDKKQKRKKWKDATEDNCSAATGEEGAPHEKQKQKQRKNGGEGEKTKRLKPTVSIAVIGSIIDNAQSLELATMVCTPYLLWWTSDYDSCSSKA